MQGMQILNLILGILETISMALGAWYFMCHVRRELYLKRWYYPAGFAVYGIFIWLHKQIPVVWYLQLGLLLLCFCAVGFILFSRKPAAVLYNIIYFLVITAAQTGMIQAVQSMFIVNHIADPYFFGNTAMILKILFVAFLTKVLVIVLDRNHVEEVSRWQLFSMFLLPVFTVLYIVTLITVGNVFIQLYGMYLMFVNFFFLLLINIYFLYLFGSLSRAGKLERDLELYRKQDEIQYRYYGELEKKYQESRKMVHDMKNHLQAVESLYHQEQREEADGYVRDMFHLLNSFGEKYYTDNRMLNIILNDKLALAHQKGIRCRVKIGEVRLGHLKDIDITTIFANILDNAIEAAEICENPVLKFKMDCIRSFQVVSLENTCSATSAKKGHMGVGLENVSRALERYQGYMQCERSGEVYKAEISLPVKEENV